MGQEKVKRGKKIEGTGRSKEAQRQSLVGYGYKMREQRGIEVEKMNRNRVRPGEMGVGWSRAWRSPDLDLLSLHPTPSPSLCTVDKYSTARLIFFLIDIFESVPA